MTHPTPAQVAAALRECVQAERWGNAISCPLCRLFDSRSCEECRVAVWLWPRSVMYYSGCFEWSPGNNQSTAGQYFHYCSGGPVGNFDPVTFRTAANAQLLARADKLEKMKP